ncbi:putative inactive serine/threonine-protein kinase bub1 [Prunus yedoensis var. nudiflora]|uniref:Putative inactive serine/threonine-protein kinase bub1 n=1 Tax=Prunus yedoensis var. nudiflora TaxID=2094558 RepID=A0A314XY15_PRUYE|nr:putative inactive serine/threonine-protein kinase bub1 [Prunus yedoensis var. nudiflora]
MNDSLPPHTLKEKLPRFLQKCAQTFESDRRYRNDLRYIRVWLKLMDFVDDPRALLRKMEANQIGTKHSLFYQAYALYYEKNKKFEEAEKMYQLGVQNLAEPIGALEKSYEQFLLRMERHRRHRNQCQEKRTTKRPLSDRSIPPNGERNKENAYRTGARPIEDEHDANINTAIVGKSEAEDACHHGLVDPTINMKEAMSAINNMFREPLETAPVSRRSRQCQRKDDNLGNGFKVFVDGNLENRGKSEDKKEELSFPVLQHSRTATQQSHQEPLNIFIDDDKDSPDQSDVQNSTEDSTSPASHGNVFVFPNPKDLPGESSGDLDVGAHLDQGLERIPWFVLLGLLFRMSHKWKMFATMLVDPQST